MHKFMIDGSLVEAPEGIVVFNYFEDDEPRFNYKLRTKPLKNLVLHETAGRTAKGCKSTLLKKGYGVQLILDRDGTVSCHGDLVRDRMVHGNQLNDISIGIEVVNPYAPSIARKMNVRMIPAEWWTWCPDKDDRRYVLPSQEQLDVILKLVPWLCGYLQITYKFPTIDLNAKKPKIKGWDKFPKGWQAKPKPGIVCHRDYASHADGRYILEYLYNKTVS